MNKVLCFHPALAPYRVDFFNLLSDKVELKILFLQDNLFSQKFNQVVLKKSLKCKYGCLTRGLNIGSRCIRFGILRAIKEMSPDVVLSYESSFVTLLLCLYKKFVFRALKVWTFMDDSPDQVRSRRGLRKSVRDWVVRNVDRVIVPSVQAAAAYSGVSTARFSVIPIVHDTVTIRKDADKVYGLGEIWRKRNLPQSWHKVLLFVGRLVKIKNLDWLIDHMAMLPNDMGLVIVGDGEENVKLNKHVQDLGLTNRVFFAGRKEGDALYAMMAMSDALVLCSHSETYGAVVAEALQWGTPCVVAKHLGASILINSEATGRLFDLTDSQTFTDAFANLPGRARESILPVDLRKAVGELASQS